MLSSFRDLFRFFCSLTIYDWVRGSFFEEDALGFESVHKLVLVLFCFCFFFGGCVITQGKKSFVILFSFAGRLDVDPLTVFLSITLSLYLSISHPISPLDSSRGSITVYIKVGVVFFGLQKLCLEWFCLVFFLCYFFLLLGDE